MITTGVYEDAAPAGSEPTSSWLTAATPAPAAAPMSCSAATSPEARPSCAGRTCSRASLIYWQRRPSLSYLFSGLLVGPTSQALRVDEARQDSLYELEIALGLIPKPGEAPSRRPRLVDRLLRNLLADVTGNTHRTEICIDKLYSPDGPTGRLGLLEFRGFEMPPDLRMNLAQHLLIRAPSSPGSGASRRRAALVRWGTALHDRFMLPALRLGRLPGGARRSRRAPATPSTPPGSRRRRAFRFPCYGQVEYGGVTLELRHALEPWHVMGEENSARRHGAVRGLLGRAAAGHGDGLQSGAPRRSTRNGRALPMTLDRCLDARPWPASASRRGSRPAACTRSCRSTAR